MATGQLPKIGTKYGPCKEACAHRDCASTRRMAEHKCRLCGKPIGYGVSFFRDDQSDNAEHSIHANCAYDEALVVTRKEALGA